MPISSNPPANAANKARIRVILSILLALLTAGSVLAAGSAEDSGEQGIPYGTKPQERVSVLIVDSLGREVEVPQPVESVVSLNSGLSEVVAALGAMDRSVGRCSYSTFPSGMTEIPVLGKHSYSPNMESIAAIQPDLVIADPMFDKGKIEILEGLGIAVIIESTSNPERLPLLIRNIGTALGETERAEELIDIVESVLNNVSKAIEDLDLTTKTATRVFFENRKDYKSVASGTGFHYILSTAGGHNIAGNEPVRYPVLNPEFITIQNPEIIIRRTSGDADEEGMQALRASILSRPGIASTSAITNQKVFVMKSDLFISLRYPVGMAYIAKILYPEINLNPREMHRQMIEALYGPEEWDLLRETYVYPAPVTN